MEHLFKTQLTIEGQSRNYDVFFNENDYHFAPLDGGGPEVLLRREHDEWHPQSATDPGLNEACIGLLETYLLSQH
ncbi:MAG: hypothetical protein EOO16_00705 [Chitinophagaceae bacterium]|nr:MAG: hypothetical protein EOO16_00705 [Chitinophagaceae bacterium]